MHTFFINTSKKDLSVYDVLFEIHYERKSMISLACPMDKWDDPEKGYKVCVEKMREMIEGFVELTDAYNLIVYIDLAENEDYASIPRGEEYDRQREAYCRAMYILYTRVINSTIVDTLDRAGSKPRNILLMFGQEKAFLDEFKTKDDAKETEVRDRLFGCLGLPDEKAVKKVKFGSDGKKLEDQSLFEKEIAKLYGEELIPGIRLCYQNELELWMGELYNRSDLNAAQEYLFRKIKETYSAEKGKNGVEMVSCPYDCEASKVNKRVMALTRLNIALHVYKCVENNSIYEVSAAESSVSVAPYYSYTAEEIAPLLLSKKDQYTEKDKELGSLESTYSKLKLAPKPRVFDHNKFHLDEYGGRKIKLVVSDVPPQEKNPDQTDAQKDKHHDVVKGKGNTKKVEAVYAKGESLFKADEFRLFDSTFEYNGDAMLDRDTKPDEFIEQAYCVRMHHINYLKKLKIHIKNALSNYAGNSKDNKAALLQMGRYRYEKGDHTDQETDQAAILETREGVAEQAYNTVMRQYMEFNASRNIEITDIEEQCDWFVNRVDQITESLKRLKLVAVGVLAGIVLLYLPFLILQFESIVRNVITVAVAAASFLVPVGMLYAIFGYAVRKQKDRYVEAWKEFKKKSDEALMNNTRAAQMYDELLCFVTPSLRWVYEYRLDIAYAAECCSVADAKINHHKMKIRERIEAIDNILGDLEYVRSKVKRDQKNSTPGSIDYSVPFCTGEDNQKFYSVVDLNRLTRRKA